ncbi:mobilization protein (plasmid) [Streptomyces sp. NBC_01213]|uniref:mobilization protein n=1 Tax=Streptomyces sp. NBC_01213 TaxID=2903776 RepID=UPI002F90EC7F|nr:mobilization protein [Streptomyces sp. NBC_01213]WSQ82752.1 mobilization protein [Streptomyces sp. NBC_01213]
MPKKADSGSDTFELLEYLYGPGRHNEHTDPHLVAAWDPNIACPARDPHATSLGTLALLLDAPVDALAGSRPAEHVWHASVRNADDDRLLTDAEWAEAAAAMVNASGIAEHGDAHACRWIAVRHAPDHIHIVATLARADGRQPRIRGDILRMHTAAREFEARWGLTPMSPADRTARRFPTMGELAKADRRGMTETARQILQRTVREAAALATSDTEFLDRCRDAGLRVRERRDETGILLGYAVALPGDRADRGTRPVWFPGSKLAYDLSLPRIRERYDLPAGPVDWTTAEARIREAAVLLGAAGRTQGAGDVAALGDLLAVAAAHSPALVRDRLQQAAAAFEQASRAPGARSLEGRARAGWRASARALQQAPRTARGGGGAPVILHLLIALIEAVEATHRWHQAAEHRAQARAAAHAAVLLREAATATGAPARPAPRATTRTPTRATSKTTARGPAPSPPVTRVPPRTGPDRPGPSRTH